ncbi:small conductance mechanosensitive channel [Klenkia soli]|uniref:Small conductance mechanosensitive channel n=1 Tax=Klenkia soli TaxID=1052260 RepID=A0A1H0EM23_9ACTN|nr:mechanosensitive ion channel family protein [Klenkia soli]SDN83339.1 small conductance mechanosensitive channel [Klenkia soli]
MDVLAIAPLGNLADWVRGRGLAVLLIILGSVLLARLVTWIGGKVTARIDASAGGGDALVRSEAAKHRHSLTQVLQWVAVVVIYTVATVTVLSTLGLPVTSLVAPATVLGVGLGFGAQRVVQDVLAGFFLITERQYGFGDVVSINLAGGIAPAEGTVEDVTLRITRMRSVDGEVVIIPNGQITKVVNLSRDWARAVIDVPVPASTDVTHVQEVLREVGEQAFADEELAKLLLDVPSVMGVTSLGLDEVNVRIVARTLPGKQFDVGRDLRSRIALAFRREGIVVQPHLPEDAPDREVTS